VICHLDTSDWNPAYPAFEMLHAKPGDSSDVPLPYANLLFGVKAANTMASLQASNTTPDSGRVSIKFYLW